ncbi:MAG: STAS domain-containing protein [Methylococcales bacterium]
MAEKDKTEKVNDQDPPMAKDESEPTQQQLDAESPVDESTGISDEIAAVEGVLMESALVPERLEKVILQKTNNMQGVADLTKKIIHLMDNNDAIELDGSQVDSIDTSTLQVLVAAAREANQLHKDFTINTPSQNFIDAARLVGVAEDLLIQ